MPSLSGLKAKLKPKRARIVKDQNKTSEATPVLSPIQVSTETQLPIPPYALKYAPVCYLYKDETYWPGSPVDHLKDLTPMALDGTEISVPDAVGYLLLDTT